MEPPVSSIPQNKQELHHAITLAFDNILIDYSTIPEEYSRTVGVEGNTKGNEITVCDTVSYLIGWGKLVLKWYTLTSKGKTVDFPDTGYKWNELGKLAEAFHYQYSNWAYNDLLLEFSATTNKLLSLIESLENHELYSESWYEKYTLGRMIQFNTSSPMKNMRAKIRRFKKAHSIK
jgi:hypothetical protein